MNNRNKPRTKTQTELSSGTIPLYTQGYTPAEDRRLASPNTAVNLAHFAMDYPHQCFSSSCALHADSFDWLERLPENSLHAIVCDPPYGVKEYETDQIEKRDIGVGGIWRLPPSFDGNTRAALPRFTALNLKERDAVRCFFLRWSALTVRTLRPGGHVIIASNSFLSQLVLTALIDGGLEFRGELIRLVRTLRGGDRPENAEIEFSGVSSLARGCYEPWGILRKPLLSGMKVSDCLREYQTGGYAAPVTTSRSAM